MVEVSERWVVVGGGGGSGIRFPFGCSRTHSHHCRQCRGKSPLHDAPEKEDNERKDVSMALKI